MASTFAPNGAYIERLLPNRSPGAWSQRLDPAQKGLGLMSQLLFLPSPCQPKFPCADSDTKTSSLASSIKERFPGLAFETADTSEIVADMLRGLRQHAHKLLKQLQEGDEERAQLGLGHAYSRARVKFSVQKNDNHIIQAIATLDHLDKAINMFSMRVREWYSWHFPELIRIVSENHQYAKLALFIGDKKRLSDNDVDDLAEAAGDDTEVARSIIDAAKVSMGQDISDTDMQNVTTFASRVVNLANYRKTLYNYLVNKMSIVAPNLAALIGEIVGARLISHAGSLTSLSKYPASTVQILGAEKALFRALKTKGNTPKYGLIYHSSFIGKAGVKNKGRISRFLANKCSIASRIDNFSETPTTTFGEALKAQVSYLSRSSFDSLHLRNVAAPDVTSVKGRGGFGYNFLGVERFAPCFRRACSAKSTCDAL